MADDAATIADDAPPVTAKSGATADAPGGEASASASAVTINRAAGELFDYWRDFANLPHFMDNVERIDVIDDRKSHWVVKAPAGETVEWDAEIVEEQPGSLLVWRSVEGADVSNSGRVEFRDAGARGTVVTATIAYDPPAGVIGKLIAKLFQREPAIQGRRDLRRFKQIMETGEVASGARNHRLQSEGKN